MLVADTFIQYLYTSEYADSAIPFRIYLLILPVRVVVFGSLLMALGKNKFILFRSIVGLFINAAFSIFLVWQFSPWGAVAATVMTMYLWIIPSCIYVLSKEMDIRWFQVLPFEDFGKVSLQLLPLATVCLLIILFVKNIHLEFGLIVACFACFLVAYWEGKLYTYEEVMLKFRNISQVGNEN